jgi:hypothetical protein
MAPHRLESFNVELGETSAAGTPQYILTLGTSGGFSVSFSGSHSDLSSLGSSLCGDIVPLSQQSPSGRRLS